MKACFHFMATLALNLQTSIIVFWGKTRHQVP